MFSEPSQPGAALSSEEAELKAIWQMSPDRLDGIGRRCRPQLCKRLSAVNADGEIMRDNWVQRRDGVARNKAPAHKRRLRSGIKLVGSHEVVVNRVSEALTLLSCSDGSSIAATTT